MTPGDRAGTPATDCLAESRREWEAYQARKARLRRQERSGKISPAEYATRIRELAQRHGL